MPTHTPGKYRPFPTVSLPDRRWPDRVTTQAPAWCSVDLRDGNQALAVPMDALRKGRMFELLVEIGFKEIEVGFPSANDTEFAFVRGLIEDGRVPDDVTVQALTPCRRPHIRRTFEALHGARRAIVHLYNSTSELQRRLVFGTGPEGVRDLAVQGARWVREEAEARPGTEWVFQYSPESFTATEPKVAVDVVNSVLDVWEPTPERKVIVNLPATVELSTPNGFADRVEHFARHVARRDGVVLSVHTHNDRGTGVAAAELALLAGAERVEGTLFGNGERTGNTCLVTMALNLFGQGVDPKLDLSAIDAVREVYEASTGMAVPPRHPYAGDLVFTAFSGSHQDAIRKGLAALVPGGPWEVPYVPVDPADLGRGYGRLIRVNGQSGKGGAAHLLERAVGLTPPRALEAAFGLRVKRAADRAGGELSPEKVAALFRQTYANVAAPMALADYRGASNPPAGAATRLHAVLVENGERHAVAGEGNGPIDALCHALAAHVGESVTVRDYAEHAVGAGSSATAAAYVQAVVGGRPPCWGVGLDTNVATASLLAVVAAVNRAVTGELD
jgi:2-isopropylmalate synthase